MESSFNSKTSHPKEAKKPSSMIYEADLRSFIKSANIPEFLDAIPKAVKSHEGRFKEFQFIPIIEEKNPTIVDLGSGNSPHFYKMMDVFGENGFSYLGVELKYAPGEEQFLKHSQLKHSNLYLLNESLYSPNIVNQIKQAVGNRKIDILLIEDLAVGNANTDETDKLLKHVINELAPKLLDENGMIHIEAASTPHQTSLIENLLKNQNGLHFIKTNSINYVVVKNPELLKQFDEKFSPAPKE